MSDNPEYTPERYDIWNPPDDEGKALANWSRNNDQEYTESIAYSGQQEYNPYSADYDAQSAIYDMSDSGAQPSYYWDNPQTIGRYGEAIRSLQNEQELPPYLDVNTVNEAYNRYKELNGGEDYPAWTVGLPDGDPLKARLQQLEPPPPELMRPDEYEKMQQGGYVVGGNQPYKAPAINGVFTVDADVVERLDPTANTKYQADRDGRYILTQQQLDDLRSVAQAEEQKSKAKLNTIGIESVEATPAPDWQKAVMPYVPYVLPAAIGGVFGGPVGAITGLAIGAAGMNTEVGQKIMGYMGRYSEALEAELGALSLYANTHSAAIREGKSGSEADAAAAEVWKELPNVFELLGKTVNPWSELPSSPAFEAGKAYYETFRGEGSLLDNLFTPEQNKAYYERQNELARLAEQNPLLSSVNNALGNTNAVQGWDMAWKPTDPNFVQYQAMKEIRDRIKGGETASEVVEDVKSRFGFSGLTRDLVGQTVLDPWELMPKVPVKGMEAVGKITGNEALAGAMKGSENVIEGFQRYGVDLRSLPIDEARQYGAISKVLAGLTQAGESAYNLPKDAKLSGWDRAAKFMNPEAFAATPASKAMMLTRNLIDGVKILGEAETTPRRFVDVVKGITNLKPGEAAKTISTEAALSPVALREVVKPLEEMAELWDNTRNNARVFENIGATLGENPRSIIAELHNSTDAQARGVTQRFIDAVNKRAAMGDQQAAELVKVLSRDEMAGNLKKWADQFATSAPFDMEHFRTKAYKLMDDSISKFGVDYFGVKPPSGLVRGGLFMKNLFNPVMLMLSPSYYLNNLINNTVQLAHDGILGLSTKAGRDGYWGSLGMNPERRGANVSPLDADISDRGSIIHQAQRADDWFQGVQDKLNPTAWLSKVIKLGNSVEASAGDNALTTAHRKAWARSWQPGRGMSKMDDSLRAGLDAIQPGLSDAITNEVRRARLKSDVANSIYDGGTSYHLDDVLDADGKELLQHFPDLYDEVNTKLLAAKNGDEANTVINEMRGKFLERINKQIVDNVDDMVTKATAKAMYEGPEGRADIIDDVARDYHNFHVQHWRHLDEVWGNAEKMTPEARRAYLDNEFKQIDEAWKAQRNIQDTKILGLIKGMGTSENATATEAALLNIHDGWSNFYQTRTEEWRNYGDWLRTAKPSEADAMAQRAVVEKKIDDAYRLALDIEADAEGRITEVMKQALAEKLNMTPDQVGAWRDMVLASRSNMAEAVRYFRQADGNVSDSVKAKINEITGGEPLRNKIKVDQGKAWDRFVAEVWTPLEAESLKIRLRQQMPVAEAAPVVPQQPTPQDEVQVPGQRTPAEEQKPNAPRSSSDSSYDKELKNRQSEAQVPQTPTSPREQEDAIHRAGLKADYEYDNALIKEKDAAESRKKEVYSRLSSLQDEIKAVEKEIKLLDDKRISDKTTLELRKAKKDLSVSEKVDILSPSYKTEEGRNFVLELRKEGRLLVDELQKKYDAEAAQREELDAQIRDMRSKKAELSKKENEIGKEYEAAKKDVESAKKRLDRFRRGDIDEETRAALDKRAGEIAQRLGTENGPAEVAPQAVAPQSPASPIDNLTPEQLQSTADSLRQHIAAGDTSLQADLDAVEQRMAQMQGVLQAPEAMSPEAYRSMIASEAHKAGLDGGKKRLLASYNRHMGENVQRLEDIPQENIPVWLQKRQEANKPMSANDIQQRASEISQELGVEHTPVEIPATPREAQAPQDDMVNLESRTTRAFGADPNKDYEFRYRIVDLDDLVASHDTNLNTNPDFPPDAQPRLRERAASQLQINDIINQFDPRKILFDSHSLENGPMIVDNNLVVEAGNGRTIALRKMAQDSPEKYKAYVDELKSRLGNYGFTEADLQGVSNPVLVRERTTQVDNRQQFVDEANTPSVMSMSPIEQAIADARKINRNALANLVIGESQTIEQALRSPENADFMRGFIAGLPQTERAKVMDKKGNISAEGIRRAKTALFSLAYPGDAGTRLLEKFTESTDNTIKSVQNALSASLPAMSQLEAKIATGAIDKGLSISDDISKVIDVYSRLKQQKMSVNDYLAQAQVQPELDTFQRELLSLIDSNKRKVTNTLRDIINKYSESAVQQVAPGQMSMFGEDVVPATTKGELFAKAVEAVTPGAKDRIAAEQAAYNDWVSRATSEPEPQIELPRGTIDSLSNPPLEEAALEAWMKDIDPMLKRAGSDLQASNKMSLKDALSNADPQTQMALKAQIAKWQDDLASTKMRTLREAEAMRDFALLNYDKKTTADTYLSTIAPYQFWYTHSMLNWGLRALARPDIMVNYERLRKYFEQIQEHDPHKDTLPYRLRNKVGIKLPFLPDFMGDTLYSDPMRQLYPFVQLQQPFRKYEEQVNMETRKAEGAIKQMVEDEQITAAEGEAALKTKTGKAWDKAVAIAQTQLDEEIKNPADFVFGIYSPQYPIAKAIEKLSGREAGSQLPATKLLQNITAAAGIGGPRGYNIEAQLLNNPDRFEDYRVDRMLANMVADGVANDKDAMFAMMNRQGPTYEEAQRRVSQMGLYQYFGAPMGVDFFPEGEEHNRALRDEYNSMIEKWKGGDKTAYSQFFEKYPEYAVRNATFKEPEERMRAFLRSEIWQAYNGLQGPQKQQLSEQLGPDFKNLFLNSETRSYNDISTETYATWAKALGGAMPKDAHAASLTLNLAPPEAAKAVQAYMDEKNKLFPEVWKLTTILYGLPPEQQKVYRAQHPEINEYTKWNNRYLAQHKEILPYVINDKSELYGLPANQQSAVYNYRALYDQYFPNIDQAWAQYQSIPDKAARRQFWDANPQLEASMKFQEQYAAKYPQIASHIISDKKLSQMIEGDIYLPKRVQSVVDNYYTTKDKMFPNIDQKWQVYSTLDKVSKRAYWRANPDLERYMAWKNMYAASQPEAAPYILGQNKLSEKIVAPEQVNKLLASMSPELAFMMMNYTYSKDGKINNGGKRELQRLWEQQGRPGGDLDTFIDEYIKPSMRYGSTGQ